MTQQPKDAPYDQVGAWNVQEGGSGARRGRVVYPSQHDCLIPSGKCLRRYRRAQKCFGGRGQALPLTKLPCDLTPLPPPFYRLAEGQTQFPSLCSTKLHADTHSFGTRPQGCVSSSTFGGDRSEYKESPDRPHRLRSNASEAPPLYLRPFQALLPWFPCWDLSRMRANHLVGLPSSMG